MQRDWVRMGMMRALLTFFSSVSLPQKQFLVAQTKSRRAICAVRFCSLSRETTDLTIAAIAYSEGANTTSLPHTCKWSILNGLTDSPSIVSMHMFVGRVSDHISLSVDVAEHGSAWQRSQTCCRGRGRGWQRGAVRLQTGGYQSWSLAAQKTSRQGLTTTGITTRTMNCHAPLLAN